MKNQELMLTALFMVLGAVLVTGLIAIHVLTSDKLSELFIALTNSTWALYWSYCISVHFLMPLTIMTFSPLTVSTVKSCPEPQPIDGSNESLCLFP